MNIMNIIAFEIVPQYTNHVSKWSTNDIPAVTTTLEGFEIIIISADKDADTYLDELVIPCEGAEYVFRKCSLLFSTKWGIVRAYEHIYHAEERITR